MVVIGEAPGAEEDRQGEPIRRACRATPECHAARHRPAARNGVHRQHSQVSPPGNRDPAPVEVSRCLPYLSNQIALLKPKIILAVGRIAAQNLLATDVPWRACAASCSTSAKRIRHS
jgi:DNA polymerase